MCIFNPLIHLSPLMCFLTADDAGPVAEKGTHAMYEVDRETHAKAVLLARLRDIQELLR